MSKQNDFPELKIVSEEVEVEYHLELYHDGVNQDRKKYFDQKASEMQDEINAKQNEIDSFDAEIERLSNHVDGLDNMVAVGSGILAGLIDSLWVGEFSLDRGIEWGDKKTKDFVIKTSQLAGYEGNSLEGAVKYLEDKFPFASDSNTNDFGGGKQHHLRDFGHHPNRIGLTFSLLTQFTRKSFGTDTAGRFIVVDVKNQKFIGEDLPKKLLFGFVFWLFHVASDIAGSSSTISKGERGTGLPGPLVSFAKLISTLPIFNLTDKKGNKVVSVWVSKLFNGTLFSEREEDGKLIKESVKNFDLRAEIGVKYELGRQAIPVIVNESIVRAFYFIRRFISELKDKEIGKASEISKVDWSKTLPFNNRTIARMMTIATGTFTMVDMLDATIRGAIQSGGHPALFFKGFLLRLNFVGVGRFTVAISTDLYMGVKKGKAQNQRTALVSEQLHVMNAKVFYRQAGMWVVAEDTEQAINEAIVTMEATIKKYVEVWYTNRESMKNILNNLDEADKHNPSLKDYLGDIINWG